MVALEIMGLNSLALGLRPWAHAVQTHNFLGPCFNYYIHKSKTLQQMVEGNKNSLIIISSFASCSPSQQHAMQEVMLKFSYENMPK